MFDNDVLSAMTAYSLMGCDKAESIKDARVRTIIITYRGKAQTLRKKYSVLFQEWPVYNIAKALLKKHIIEVKEDIESFLEDIKDTPNLPELEKRK